MTAAEMVNRAPEGHGRFAIFNRTVNPLVRALLRSPLHRVASDRLALITVVGRRSGEEHTFPVGYRREGDRVTIDVGWPERKLWWRNLLKPAPVRMQLAGEEVAGTAVARSSADEGVRVEVALGHAG